MAATTALPQLSGVSSSEGDFLLLLLLLVFRLIVDGEWDDYGGLQGKWNRNTVLF
jgi:hypothetical protein